jgi:hypothetical protein
VNARPEVTPPVKARPELPAQLVETAIVVSDESREAPVATIVYDLPGFAVDGIFTVVEKELAEFVVAVPRVIPLSVKVTNSIAAKSVPATVKDPPGTEHAELVLSPIAFGS